MKITVPILFVFLVSLLIDSAVSPAGAIETGKLVPDFSATSYTGKVVSSAGLKGKTVVLEWFNRDCPFVKKHYSGGHMQKLQKQAAESGVIWLTVNSTAKDSRSYLSPEETAKVKDELKIESADLLIDADGVLGKQFDAKTTPHLFILDPAGKLVYQGAIDNQADTTSDPDTAENYVAEALKDLREGKPVKTPVTQAYGCSVKYAS